MTASENGTYGATLLRRALAALLACAMTAAYCLPAEALAEALEGAGPTDIAEEWAQGALTISGAGSYTLSQDVETDGSLTILAEEGEQIELDLAGHSVTVEGDVFCGVDVSGSLGSVSIVDSEYDADDPEAERASIDVTATCAEDAVAGVLANFALPDDVEEAEDAAVPSLALEGISVSAAIAGVSEDTAGEEHDVSAVYAGYEEEDDPRSELDVALEDVELAASATAADGADAAEEAADGGAADGAGEAAAADLPEGAAEPTADSVGVAYGVYADAAGVCIDGAFASEAVSDKLDCGLYSTVEGAFELGAGFALEDETRVYAAGNAAGAVFASVDEGLEAGDGLLGQLVDGSGAGNVLELSEDGGSLVFAEAADAGAEGGDDAADGAEDAEGAATISSVIEGLLEGAAAEEAGQDASETISSALAALSAAAEDDAEDADGSALSALSEGSTWTVTDSSGATVGSYDDFDDAEDALADGGVVTLNEDLGATYASDGTVTDASTSTAVTFDGKSSGSYTIDLAGHMLGEVKFTCAADLTITSSADGGGLDGAQTNYGIYASSSGALTVEDVEITNACAGSLAFYYGVYLYKASSAVLEGVDVDVGALGGTLIAKGAYGLYALSCGSLGLEDCSLSASATSTSTSGYAYGASLVSTTATLEDCTLSATRAGSMAAYGLNVGTSSTATVTDCSLSATSESGTAYGAYVSKTLTASGAAFSASSDGGSGYALVAGSSSSVSLGAGCSFDGSAADLYIQKAVTLASGFTADGTLSVYNKSILDDDAFATLASDLDAESLAEKFEAASGSYYEGYEAAASADGSSLVWESQAEWETADLYELLSTADGAVYLEPRVEYYLSQSYSSFPYWVYMRDAGEYSIDLRGNELSFSSNGLYLYPSSTTSKVKASISSTDGEGNAEQGALTGGQICCEGYVSLSMSDVDYTLTSGAPTSYLSTPIYLGSGAYGLELEGCDIKVAASGSSSSRSYLNAIRVESSSLSSASIKDTTIEAAATGTLNAVALYVVAKGSSFDIEDSKLSATSTGGSAIALYNDKYWTVNPQVALSGEVTLAATGGQLSIGAFCVVSQLGTGASSSTGTPVLLDGDIAFETDASYDVAALATEAEATSASGAAFAVGPSFTADEALSVACGMDVTVSTTSGPINFRPFMPTEIPEDANAKGTYFASFASGVAESSYETVAALFSNANSAASTTAIAVGNGGLVFRETLEYERAAIERGGETLTYETLEDATADAADGETVELLCDLDQDTIAESDSADAGSISYAIDFAGFDAASITCETSQDVTVTNSSEESDSEVSGYGGDAGVTQAGSGTLTLEGISIDVQNAASTSNYGLRVTAGEVIVNDCLVSVDATSGAAYAVALSGGAATLADCAVSACAASSSDAAALLMASAQQELALSGCDVAAEASAGEADALSMTYGSAALEGCTLAAESASGDALAASAAYSTSLSLDGCTLDADGGGQSWCVSAPATQVSGSASAATVELAGDTVLASSADTHVLHAVNALSIASDFSTSSTVVVRSASLADASTMSTFAAPAEDGGDLSSLASAFEADSSEDCDYAGCSVVANTDGSLSWDKTIADDDDEDDGDDGGGDEDVAAPVAETGGVRYYSLASALAAAEEGATVTMLADSTESGLTVSQDVTVDLAGFDVAVSASAYGVQVSAGRLTLTDSGEEEGSLSVRLTGTATGITTSYYTAADATTAGRRVGLYASSGAGVTLSGASVEVTYANSSFTSAGVTGAYAASGAASDGEPAILLQEGSALSVDAGDAIRAYGAYVGSTSGAEAAGIEVDEGAEIAVTNDGDFVTKGYSNPSLNSTVAGEAWLKELEVDTSSDLWAEICEKFLLYATFDSTYDVYGMSLVELSDGSEIWAYSDVVDEEDIGDESVIVPSVVFMLSDADISPDAIGIGDYGSSGSTIVVEGSVSVTSENGNAYALRTSVYSSWDIDGAELSAVTYGTEDYLRLSNYAPGIYGDTLQGVNTYRLVERVDVEAACVSVGEVSTTRWRNGYTGSAEVTLDGGVSMVSSAAGGFAADVMFGQVLVASGFSAEEGSITVSDEEGETSWGDEFAASADGETAITSAQAAAFADSGKVFVPTRSDDALTVYWGYETVGLADDGEWTVTFTGARDSSGSKLSSSSATTSSGVLGAEGAAAAPAAESYGSWRFAGWQDTGADEPTIIDPECLATHSFSADTDLVALYLWVGSGSQLIVFKVDGLLYPYVATGGAAVTWKQALAALGSSSEDYPERASTGTWEFAGWKSGYVEDYLSLGDGDYDYQRGAALPTAVAGGEDAYYTAVFSGSSATYSTVTLCYYSDWDGSGSWTYGSGSFTLEDGVDISSDESVTSGSYLVSGVPADCVTDGGKDGWQAHEFLGWSTRSTDKAALSVLPAVGEGVSTYYAIYDTHDMEVEATFYDDDGDEGCTVTVASTASVSEAMESEDYTLEAPDGMQLAGWAYEAGATETSFVNGSFVYMYSSDNFSAPENGSGELVGTASFYAVWTERDPVDVVLHLNGGLWSSSNSDDLATTATPGVAISWDSYSAPYQLGCYFLEWNGAEDGSGEDFDVLSDAVPDEGLELWAQYGEISAADGTQADVSAAYVRSRSAAGSDAVEVSLTSAGSADSNLTVSSSAYTKLSSWRLAVKAVFNVGTSYETSAEVNEGFGTLSLSVSVDSSCADRDVYAFVLGSSGSTTSAACELSEASDGTLLATFSVSSYALSTAANVVVAYALTEDEINLASAISQAMAQLNEYYATFSQDDYTGDESTGTWGQLCSYYEDGLAAIKAATSVEEVTEAYETAANGMASVDTAAGIALAQAEALEELAEAYATYSSEDYSAKNWKKLVAAYEAAKEAIQSAETVSDAYSASSAGIIAMAKVKMSSGSSSSSLLSSLSSSSSSSSSTLASSSGSSSSSTLSASSGSTLSGATGLSSTGSSASGLASTASNAMSMLEGEFLTVTETVADAFALKASSGVVVLTVEEGGAMDAAGFRVGDVIVAVDGNAITTLDELEDYLSGLSAGDTVTFTVNRGGEEVELTVTLSAAADDSTLTQASDETDGDSDGDDATEGSGGPLKWIGSHLGLIFGILFILLLIAGILIGLLMRRRRAEEDDEDGDGGDDDGFWDDFDE